MEWSAWHHAHLEERDYITPEDVLAAAKAAIAGRREKLELVIEVLDAMSNKAVEDRNLTAYVLAKYLRGEALDEEA